MNPANSPANAMRIRYTDRQGKTAVRRILPVDAPYLGATPDYPETQWLMRAIDVDRALGEGERVFAMARMEIMPLPRTRSPERSIARLHEGGSLRSMPP